MVRPIAGLSVLVSIAALVLTDVVTGDPLPVQTINLSVIAAGAAVMAVLLHRATPRNNVWRVLLLIAVVGPVAVVLFALAQNRAGRPEALIGAVWLLDVALAVPWMLFFGLFPDGHRPIQRWRALVLGSALVLTAVSVVAWLSAPDGAPLPVPGHLPGVVPVFEGGGLHAGATRTASILVGVLPLVAAVCLLLRYTRSGPLVRQQIRVGAVGLSAGVLLEVALRTLPGVEAGKVHFGIAVVAVAVGAFGVAAALLRWRLWVVDQALPRAVVLGACSAAFTAAIVLAATIVTGGLRKEQVQGAVLAAVVVTVLVHGYSRRLEPWVREIVYGKRPGGYAVLVGLADGLAAGGADAASTGSPTRRIAAWRCPGPPSGRRPPDQGCTGSRPRPAKCERPTWFASARTSSSEPGRRDYFRPKRNTRNCPATPQRRRCCPLPRCRGRSSLSGSGAGSR